MTNEDRVRNFIRTDLGAGASVELSDDYPLIENAVIDSLGIFEMVRFIESEFDVEVDDEDLLLDNFATIADIARLVDAKQAQQAT
ncbi:MAG TPA: acyl carrier protein [Acidimicrobiales bacterium]|jgi:acyl carrier protein|nr:acyl carrier protein [Acidimicrobiales bacterium]HWH36046.1 acyl carrier protein [Acidimicrobiales bacterium]